MQRHTFLRALIFFGYGYGYDTNPPNDLFWPIGVSQRRELAQNCLLPAFFFTDGTAAPNMVAYTEKKVGDTTHREPGCIMSQSSVNANHTSREQLS